MDKKILVKQILTRMQLSTMSPKERMMWTVLLPVMGDEQLKKLDVSLEKETDQLMDLYLATTNV